MRITVQELCKRFGPLEVVSRVSFSIQEGELFTLLGPSGCGKTTLLRLIAGFYSAEEGEIRFNERRVNDMPPHERGIGMVFQNYALWPHMTVSENIGYGLKLRKTTATEIAGRVEGVLAKVKLAGLGARYPGQLSGGQQQRVALARALVLNPDILLLDEPLSNLDAKIRVQVRAEIRKLQKDLGITTIYVTHDQEEALTLSDRIAVFNQGKVFQVGPPKALYERPANRFVADFIGINNLIDGTVGAVAPADQRARVETALGEISGFSNERLSAGHRCVVCIRPENVRVNERIEGDRNTLKGIIAFAAYLGNALRYDVDVGQGVIVKADIRDPWHHNQLALGSAVDLSFPVSGTLVIPAE
jgi:iron(III) transport system ATP-binding protein